jgi:hypothetical protein
MAAQAFGPLVSSTAVRFIIRLLTMTFTVLINISISDQVAHLILAVMLRMQLAEFTFAKSKGIHDKLRNRSLMKLRQCSFCFVEIEKRLLKVMSSTLAR